MCCTLWITPSQVYLQRSCQLFVILHFDVGDGLKCLPRIVHDDMNLSIAKLGGLLHESLEVFGI